MASSLLAAALVLHRRVHFALHHQRMARQQPKEVEIIKEILITEMACNVQVHLLILSSRLLPHHHQ